MEDHHKFIPIDEHAAYTSVEIGASTTEVKIISPAGLIYAKSVSTGWDEMDTAIVEYMKRAHNLTIDGCTLKEIKMRAESAFAVGEEITIIVCGRDSTGNLPKKVTIRSQEIHKPLSGLVHGIVDLLRNAMERCPSDLLADLKSRGIFLMGSQGGIKGFDQILSNATGLPVVITHKPVCTDNDV